MLVFPKNAEKNASIIEKGLDEARVDNFLQITVFCPPDPRVDAFVYRNAGKAIENSRLLNTLNLFCLMR